MTDKISKNSKCEDFNTLCWKCKRCTNPSNFPCEWAEQGKQIKGWEAIKGLKYIFVKKDGTTREVFGYSVKHCPKFIDDEKIATYKEAAEEISKTLGCCVRTVYSRWQKKIEEYEKITGKTLPLWIHERVKKPRLKKKTKEQNNGAKTN